ncbi:MAG: pilus assembly protein TadG-related protein [Acidimicrobiales bacterium]
MKEWEPMGAGRATTGQRSQGGSIIPLMAVGVMLAGLMVLGLGALGKAAVSRAQAQTAADAAALAAAGQGGSPSAGRRAAGEVAEANGARLLGFEQGHQGVRVTTGVGPARATARAVSTGVAE